jgi:hypothetical protein
MRGELPTFCRQVSGLTMSLGTWPGDCIIQQAVWCVSTAIKRIFDLLAKNVGGQCKTFSMQRIRGAHGGHAGWGPLCSTLIGAGNAVWLIIGKIETSEAMTNDLACQYGNAGVQTRQSNQG